VINLVSFLIFLDWKRTFFLFDIFASPNLKQMTKLRITDLLFLIFSLLIFSCSGPNSKENKSQTVVKHQELKNDTSFLADKNFLYKDLKSTEVVELIFPKSFTKDQNLYADSAHKIIYPQLTGDQKTRLIAKFLSKEIYGDTAGTMNTYSMQAYFISKQKKIGDLRPIIVFISGDDYGSFTMILLNKNGLPVDGYKLSGGLEAGPIDNSDSSFVVETGSYSFINHNQITTIRLKSTEFTDSLTKRPSITDSMVFKTTISKKGKFNTKLVLEKRYNSVN
jgi:hypothetical protein